MLGFLKNRVLKPSKLSVLFLCQGVSLDGISCSYCLSSLFPHKICWHCNHWPMNILNRNKELCFELISLHIRSMWETICDAKASRKWQGRICAQMGQNTLFWNLVQDTPPPNWNLGRSWHFEFWLDTISPPPPRKFKFRQILAIWVLTVGVCGE